MTLDDVEKVLRDNEKNILKNWVNAQLGSLTRRKDLITDDLLKSESKMFLQEFFQAIRSGNIDDISGVEYEKIEKFLKNLSRSRARMGFSPSETVAFIFSLKSSLLPTIRDFYKSDAENMFKEVQRFNELLDKLGLKTIEEFTREKEKMIASQSETLLELSSPIIKLWENVLAVPIIGTLDSQRTQTIMENLLEMIVNSGFKISIIDITGVGIVDTQVANHLLKTVSAVKLLGAEAIITGIRPEVAQTIINLGVELTGIITRANLADGLKYAFDKLKFKVSKV